MLFEPHDGDVTIPIAHSSLGYALLSNLPSTGAMEFNSSGSFWSYVTFRLNFHHFDHFELDLRGHVHVRGAAFCCLRLNLADIVLI